MIISFVLKYDRPAHMLRCRAIGDDSNLWALDHTEWLIEFYERVMAQNKKIPVVQPKHGEFMGDVAAWFQRELRNAFEDRNHKFEVGLEWSVNL